MSTPQPPAKQIVRIALEVTVDGRAYVHRDWGDSLADFERYLPQTEAAERAQRALAEFGISLMEAAREHQLDSLAATRTSVRNLIQAKIEEANPRMSLGAAHAVANAVMNSGRILELMAEYLRAAKAAE